MGAKYVVFCGMRIFASAAARICSTVTGGNRIAASCAPLPTSAATVCASARKLMSMPSSAGAAISSNQADGISCSASGRSAAAAERAVGRGDQEGQAGGVDEADAALVGQAPLEVVDTFGRRRPEVLDGEAGAAVSVRSAVGVRDPVEQAVDRLDPELVLGELDDEAHDPAVVLGRGSRGGLLVAVGDRGLEPVVAVGQHERCGGDDVADRR